MVDLAMAIRFFPFLFRVITAQYAKSSRAYIDSFSGSLEKIRQYKNNAVGRTALAGFLKDEYRTQEEFISKFKEFVTSKNDYDETHDRYREIFFKVPTSDIDKLRNDESLSQDEENEILLRIENRINEMRNFASLQKNFLDFFKFWFCWVLQWLCRKPDA